jgi:hypothetical protein
LFRRWCLHASIRTDVLRAQHHDRYRCSMSSRSVDPSDAGLFLVVGPVAGEVMDLHQFLAKLAKVRHCSSEMPHSGIR